MFFSFYLALLLVASSNAQGVFAPANNVLANNDGLLPINSTPDPSSSSIDPNSDPVAASAGPPVLTPGPEDDDNKHHQDNSNRGDAICTKKYGYYKMDAQCDTYVECRNYRAYERLCPDGLHFNPNAHWPEYPCSYPMDTTSCRGRGAIQPAQPTASCPHQYGFYPADDSAPESCRNYKQCVAGRALPMQCPYGLAFSPDSGRCDWPENVPSCNSEAYLGFRCPPPPLDRNGQPLDFIQNYKYEGVCYFFFSCEKGQARMLSCDYGFGFDPASGRCVDADLINCNYENRPEPRLYY